MWLTLLGLAVTVLLNSGYLSNPSSYAVGPGGVRSVRLVKKPTSESTASCTIPFQVGFHTAVDRLFERKTTSA